MNIVTKTELANMWGVGLSRICNLVDLNQLEETDDGKIDLDTKKNQEYAKSRTINVPKYTGKSDEIDDENFTVDVDEEQLKRIENGEELDFTKINSKKDAELNLALIKVSKAQKENQLLEIELQKKLNKIIETDVLAQILKRSYGFLLENINAKPMRIIEKLRHIILSGEYKNNEDVKFLIDEYSSIYQDALAETKKAMLEFYGTESETKTG